MNETGHFSLEETCIEAVVPLISLAKIFILFTQIND